jgi:predicted transposase YdaD
MTQDVLFNEGEVMYLAKRFAAWDRKMERKGERKGEKKGELKGLQNTLSKLLEKRFGPIDAQTGQRIKKANLEQLDAWVLRSVDARTVSEVFEQAL